MVFKVIGLLGLLMASGCAYYVDHRASAREAAARAAFPPVGQFVEVDGTRLHAYVTGTGPDIVLIHGASGNLRDFTFRLTEALSDRYRVYAFDRPGMGYSERIDPAYARPFNDAAESPQEQAAVLSRAARMLGAENPIVLGHSYGGAVAMAWGLDQPAAALVILSGATMPWPGDLGRQYTVLGSGFGGAVVAPLVTAFAAQDRIESTVASIFAPNPVPPGYIEHVGPGLSLDRGALRANARQVNNLRPHLVRMSARYEEMSLPIELVHGAQDDTVALQLHSDPAAGLLPNARLTVLEGIGHMPHHSAPDATIAAIDRAARRAGLR